MSEFMVNDADLMVFVERTREVLGMAEPSSKNLVVDYHALIFAAALCMARSRGVELSPENLTLISERIAGAVIPVVESIGT